MVLAYACRLLGVASVAALFANVYKHGWHAGSIALGVFLSVLLFSLGGSPQGRGRAWEVRYWIALGSLLGLITFRLVL